MTPSDEIGAARMLQAGLSLLQIVYLPRGKETLVKKHALRLSLAMGRDFSVLAEDNDDGNLLTRWISACVASGDLIRLKMSPQRTTRQ
jgi:hypothetical protein